jgi:aminoglycoside 6'-N-acetyltransferase
VRLRSATEADVAPLAEILAEPEVARWWQGYSPERVREEMLGSDASEAGLVIEVDGAVAGWVQWDEEPWPEYPRVAMDIFVAPAHFGRGVARAALRAVIESFAVKGHHRFEIDPTVSNERAIRAYAKLGFKPVGVLRASERRPEGWADALLMDLLIEELVPERHP